MITSATNPKLRLVPAARVAAAAREGGLFVCEGEDLVRAAEEAGVEPVELLVAGENVEPELLARSRRWPTRRA